MTYNVTHRDGRFLPTTRVRYVLDSVLLARLAHSQSVTRGREMATADATAVVVTDAKLAAVQDGKTKTGGGHGDSGKGQMLDQDRDGRLYWLWLLFCFCGIMVAFIAYGIAMEYATSGGRKASRSPETLS